MPEQNATPRTVRLAAALVAVEGAALLGLSGVLGAATLLEPPDSYGRALFAVVLGLLAGLALLRLARGIRRLESWSRAPVIVTQILLVPIGYTLAVTADKPLYGVPVLALCAAEACLLLGREARLAFPPR